MKLREKGCGCVFRRVSGSFHLENVPALWSKSANSLNTKKVPNKCGMEQSVKGHQMLEKLGEISVRERLQHWHVWGST